MDASPDDPRSPYMRIVDDLRRKIASGSIAPGDKIPTNAELKRQYDVASQTAQNAVNLLKTEGLVYGVAGRGVFVRSDVDIDALNAGLAPDPTAPTGLGLEQVLERLGALEARVAELEAKSAPAPKPTSPQLSTSGE